MNAGEEACRDLAAANRILAHLGIVDAFGHVSMRDPDAPDRFLISVSKAPASVMPEDILSLDLDGNPSEEEPRRSYLERFIHSGIYRIRSDVGAIVHSHSPAVIPFGVTNRILRPVFHMAAGVGARVPIFEIRHHCGETSDLLIRNGTLGAALAETLGDASLILMRGHGATAVGPSLQVAVFRAAYTETNARIQTFAQSMGDVTFLSDAEIVAADKANAAQVGRAWAVWLHDAAPEFVSLS